MIADGKNADLKVEHSENATMFFIMKEVKGKTAIRKQKVHGREKRKRGCGTT